VKSKPNAIVSDKQSCFVFNTVTKLNHLQQLGLVTTKHGYQAATELTWLLCSTA